jgi:hypothetical protein
LWERKDILAFCLTFLLEYEKQVKKSQNITFFIFGYPFSSSIGDALIVLDFSQVYHIKLGSSKHVSV